MKLPTFIAVLAWISFFAGLWCGVYIPGGWPLVFVDVVSLIVALFATAAYASLEGQLRGRK